MDLPPALEGVRQIVQDLVKAIGIPCEVVLHDLRDPSRSIVAIGGDLTGRSVGGPLTDLGLRMLRSGGFEDNLISYANTTPDGKPLRSSTLFVRGESGAVIGALCINIDITYWTVVSKIVADLCQTEVLSESGEPIIESFEPSVTDMLRKIVDTAVQECGKPAPLMERAEKLEVVHTLDGEGVFLIRGAIDYVAEVLGVSRPTVYNYLSELKSGERFGRNS
jgi:predicted transcriptional regulator YheO